MSDQAPLTDEDRLIYQLTLHRDLVGWVIRKLAEAGIPSQRTTGNDPKGDILIIASRDASQVEQIICDIHHQYNRLRKYRQLNFVLTRKCRLQIPG